MKKTGLVWDMTLAWNAWLRDGVTLPRFSQSGVDVVGLTVGGGNGGRTASLEGIRQVKLMVETHPSEFVIAHSAAELLTAKRSGKLALVLNFQGTEALEGNLEAVSEFHRMGVRGMGIVWNNHCNVGSSATCAPDAGLTSFGKQVVEEMNRVGILVDCTHASYRTTMDAMAISTAPVVFTHSNVDALAASYKNLKDDQIKACAATDGVVGISGFGTYMDDLAATPEAMFRQIDYVCELVGPRHAGLGLDFVRTPEIIWEKVRATPAMWPGLQESEFFPPEGIDSLRACLLNAGYHEQDILGILGDNWFRVCSECWKDEAKND